MPPRSFRARETLLLGCREAASLPGIFIGPIREIPPVLIEFLMVSGKVSSTQNKTSA